MTEVQNKFQLGSHGEDLQLAKQKDQGKSQDKKQKWKTSDLELRWQARETKGRGGKKKKGLNSTWA